MIPYSKLIKHPVPPLKAEYIELAKKIAKEHYLSFLYKAEVIDGILAITLYQQDYYTRTLVTDMRHFYDGENWAMQRISDNKRLTSSIAYYDCYGVTVPIDDADDVISDYLHDEERKGLYTLRHAEFKRLDERLAQRHKKITDTIDARMAEVAETPPEEFYSWVENEALAFARYFFYDYKKGKEQTGYCSHCRSIFSTAEARHGKQVRCPSCGSLLTCKSYGKTKAVLVDNIDVAYVEEITENGRPTLVERNFTAYQDTYSQEGKTIVTYCEYGRLFMDAGTFSNLPDKLGDWAYNYGVFKQRGSTRWCNEGYTENAHLIYPHNLDGIMRRCRIPALKNVEMSAIALYAKSTFQHITMLVQKYPCIENLYKQGAYKLGNELLNFQEWHGVWYGAELRQCIKINESECSKALGVDKAVFRQFVKMDISFAQFYFFRKIADTLKKDPPMLIFLKALSLSLEDSPRAVTALLKTVSFERLVNYVAKHTPPKGDANQTLGVYWDYLSMAKDLRLPKTESVLFPRDLQKEHDRLVKIKADRKYTAQNKALKKRVKILEMLDFEDEDFIIRPLRSADEFLKESSVLNHCVKTYIDRCARGETNIYGIRKAADPDTPYFTLTLTNSAAVTMNLGKNNCHPPEEVERFVKKWKSKVIKKNKKKFIEAAKPQEKARKTA